MRQILNYESDQIPLAKLPYSFKQRLTSLAPLEDLNNIRQTCFECHELCNFRHEVHDQLYITDDETVYQWASKKVFVFNILRIVYCVLRWLFDGTSVRPTWHSVLTVDEVVKKGRSIYVTDTLVLHCRSVASFERLIPFICGPYTRLTIHGGSISLDQLRRLMKGTIRKVEITAFIRLQPEKYDDAVQLITQHVRGFRYNFNLKSTPQLITEVKAAVENDRYLHVKDYRGYHCNVIHKTMYIADTCIYNFLMIGIIMSAGHSMGKYVKIMIGDEKQSSHAKTIVQPPIKNDATESVILYIEIIIFIGIIFFFNFLFVLNCTLKSKPER